MKPIPLGRFLGIPELEKLLAGHYRQSKKSLTSVVFDGRYLRAGSLFSVGLLLLWFRDLVRGGSEVELNLAQESSSSADFQRLLHLWRFIDLARDLGVQVLTARTPKGVPRTYGPSAKPVVGIHFFDSSSEIDRFLEDIAVRQLEIFGDTGNLELIGSGELRNVVLRELLANVFDHAGGQAGFTAMCELPAPAQLDDRTGDTILRNAPRWEQNFLRTLPSKSYLEVVVADFGPGIFRTLNKTWKADPSRIETHATPEPNVLEYAFEKYTSSKSDPSGFLRDLVTRVEGGEAAQNPTGLYFVKSIVREHAGVLSVRSGSSWLAWDFSRGPDPRSMTFRDRGRARSIAEFRGSQFRLLFPLGRREPRDARVEKPGAEVRRRAPSHWRSVHPRSLDLDELVGQSDWDSADSLPSVVQTLRARLAEDRTQSCWFIAANQAVRTKRQALILIALLAEFQHPGLPVVLVAAGDSWTPLQLAGNEAKLDSRADEFPVLMVDMGLRLDFLGGSDAVRDGLVGLLVEGGGEDGDSSERGLSPDCVLQLRPFLLPGSWTGGARIVPLLSWSLLEAGLEEACSAIARGWRAEAPRGIRTTGRFLLPSPSNSYCENFWDIGEVTAEPGRRHLAAFLLRCNIQRLGPELVIAISSNAGLLAQEALAQLDLGAATRPELEVIENPHQQQSFMPLAFRSGLERAVVVTDVIGTGTVLVSALRLAALKNLVGVIAVVDAREKPSESMMTPHGEVEIVSLVESPQRYYRDLPAGWTYSSIRTIDPIHHKVLAAESIGLPDLVWGQDLEGVLRYCAESESLECGHYSSGKSHFSTFVLTARLIKRNRAEIQQGIIEELEAASRGLPDSDSIELSHILYNDESLSVAEICQEIATINAGCKAVGVDVELVKRGHSVELPAADHVKDVLILEPAASTGDTARALLACAGELQPRRIFLFILADRMQRYESWLLTSISGLGSSRIFTKRFMSLSSRAYPLEECPQCKLREEYEEVVGHAGDRTLVEEARARFELMEPRPISLFRDPGVQSSRYSQELAAVEAAAQSSFHAGIADISVRSSLARRIKGRHVKSMECCGILLAFSREAPLFRSEGGSLRDVLYPTVRERLVRMAEVHLSSKVQIDEAVRRAAAVALAELGFEEKVVKHSEWWQRTALDAEGTVWMLCEGCRVALSWHGARSNVHGLELWLEFLEAKCEEAEWRGELVAARRLMESLKRRRLEDQPAEAPAGAWTTCAGILRRHGHLRAALESLTSGILNPSRTNDELREYYELSWVARVRDPLITGLLPGLAALGPDLKEYSTRVGGVSNQSLGELRDLVEQADGAFQAALKQDPEEQTRFDRLEAPLRRVRLLLAGTNSPFLALVDSLVTTDLSEIEAHLRAMEEELTKAGIDLQVDLQDLPGERYLFISAPALVTCVQEFSRNISKHAFPADWKGARRARMVGRVVSDLEYSLIAEDSGRGGGANPRYDSGLGEVQRIAKAYGGVVRTGDTESGFRIQTIWRLVTP